MISGQARLGASAERPPSNGLDLRFGAVVGLVVAVVGIVSFALAGALDVRVLVEPADQMGARSVAAASVGVGLLVADVVLPVPSSLVMLSHGALFGVVPGAVLSLLGRTGNAVVGVLVGRGAARVAPRGAGRPSGRGDALVGRWGLAAVVFTRPVPVLAESTVVAAGAMGMSVPGVVAAAAMGAVPEAVLYAMVGAVAASFGNGAIVFTATLTLAGAAWVVSACRDRRSGA